MKRRRRLRPRRRGRRPAMKKLFNGGIVRGSVQPRTVSASPWCSVSLVSFVAPQPNKATSPVYYCINLSAVREQLKTELGLPNTLTIDTRVTRVDIWTSPASANTDGNFIVFSPAELTASPSCSNQRQINWYEAWGTATRPANVHYVWPKSQSVHVFADSEDIEVLTLDLKSSVDPKSPPKYLFKFALQWRPHTPDPRPSVALQLESFRGFSPPSQPIGSTWSVVSHEVMIQ